MVILGRSGSGKSYATKLYLLREWMQGARIIIIDPEREYNNIARQIGVRLLTQGLVNTVSTHLKYETCANIWKMKTAM